MKKSRQKTAEQLLDSWAVSFINEGESQAIYGKNPLADMIDSTSRSESKGNYTEKDPTSIFDGRLAKGVYQAGVKSRLTKGTATRNCQGTKIPLPGSYEMGCKLSTMSPIDLSAVCTTIIRP